MKEFKLRQWYPGLPKDWKDSDLPIIVVEGGSSTYRLHPGLKGLRSNLTLSKNTVEYTPDYWEKLLPEEDFKGKVGTYFKSRSAENNIHDIFMITHVEEDVVFFSALVDLNQEYHRKISKAVELFKNRIWVEVPLLFVSEDGVPILEGDTWYYVKEGEDKVRETSTMSYNGFNKKPVTRFSSREKAETFIKPKPLFVTEDEHEIFDEKEYDEIYGVGLQCTPNDVLRKGYNKGIGEYSTPYKNRKWFYSLEKAQEYIAEKYRGFTFNDFKVHMNPFKEAHFKLTNELFIPTISKKNK